MCVSTSLVFCHKTMSCMCKRIDLSCGNCEPKLAFAYGTGKVRNSRSYAFYKIFVPRNVKN